MARIKAAIYDGKRLEYKDISNTLKSLQKIVKGNIECPYLGTRPEEEGIMITLNEEGKIIGLPQNLAIVYQGEIVDILCGYIIFTRINEEGETVGITKADYELIKSEIYPTNFVNTITGARINGMTIR